MMQRGKGRPPTRPVQLKDGFYIEVRNKGARERGVKIHCVSKAVMESTIAQYQRNNKDVTVLGEHKDFEWESEKKLRAKPLKSGSIKSDAKASSSS